METIIRWYWAIRQRLCKHHSYVSQGIQPLSGSGPRAYTYFKCTEGCGYTFGEWLSNEEMAERQKSEDGLSVWFFDEVSEMDWPGLAFLKNHGEM